MKQMRCLALCALLAGAAAPAGAALISGHYTHGTGSRWTLDLTLSNDGSLASIPGFSLYFDQSLFSQLATIAAPAGWDALVLQPDPVGLGADGLYDALALSPADAPAAGESRSGFSLSFDYSGVGAPGALSYDIYALDALGQVEVLASGRVQPASVPEPDSWALAGLALLAMALSAGPSAHRKAATPTGAAA